MSKNLTNLILVILILCGAVLAQMVQLGATWGIARIDQRNWQNPLDTNYEYNATGTGVTVYVVDTGVLVSHPDFEGRARDGYSAVKGKKFSPDCNNHGTHVAGVIGSHTYGVAKQVNIVSVRVAPCQGGALATDVIKGLNWIANQERGVVNISFASSAINGAVQNLIDKGFVVVVAAGNDSDDACNYWNVPDALVVGATDNRDYKSNTSNFGPCVDIYAPGVNILSTWNNGSWGALSGTSTAAPHVAGVAVLYLEQHPNASPQEVQAAIIGNASFDILTDASPNVFLYSIF